MNFVSKLIGMNMDTGAITRKDEIVGVNQSFLDGRFHNKKIKDHLYNIGNTFTIIFCTMLVFIKKCFGIFFIVVFPLFIFLESDFNFSCVFSGREESLHVGIILHDSINKVIVRSNRRRIPGADQIL